MAAQPDPAEGGCSLLLLVATPAEEEGLEGAAEDLNLPFEPIKKKDSPFGEEYRWFGRVGGETVTALRPARAGGRLVMGSIGFLGTAARGLRLRIATGAQGIVQLGMAFGVDPRNEGPGDVLVATPIIPYDNRDIKPATGGGGYVTEYPQANREPARAALVELFRREQRRGGHPFAVHLGAMLSGAARIHSSFFRDELVRSVPAGEDPVIGGGDGRGGAARRVDRLGRSDLVCREGNL
jgi:adenosylhomocysteine nucleosidase